MSFSEWHEKQRYLEPMAFTKRYLGWDLYACQAEWATLMEQYPHDTGAFK